MAIRQASALRFFDAHCHLQDERLGGCLQSVVAEARQRGTEWFVVNGTSEEDWKRVRELSQEYSQMIPSFGLHPWFLGGRSKDWFEQLRKILEDNPGAAVGEAGLDKTRTKETDMDTQVEILRQQLELAREMKRPISVHCVRAYGPLQDLLREFVHFPDGLIVHSYSGSAEQVAPLAACGAYFSFSGFLHSTKPDKAAHILAQVPPDRLLLETDAPDALPRVDPSELIPVPPSWATPAYQGSAASRPAEECCPLEVEEGSSREQRRTGPEDASENIHERGHNGGQASGTSRPEKPLNHPGNIAQVASLVSRLLGRTEEEVTETTFANGFRLFNYPTSKLHSR